MNDALSSGSRYACMGVPIDAVTRSEAVSRIRRFLGEPRGHFVTTPNPEMLVDARTDVVFRRALASADLAVPDGQGLVLVARLKGIPVPERVTGTDLVEDVAALASETGESVFLLGGRDGVAAQAAAVLTQRHPGLRIAGVIAGGELSRDTDGAWRADEGILAAIKAAAPGILLVAFGHGKQETWIHANLATLPSVRVAIGIGGAFDFLAGRVQRAPAWMRRLWIEWLWRLFQEPRRIKRILKATIVFPYLALTSKK